ncbi:MAG: TolB family protein, partial [Gammaproteobacteria bacterium]
MRSRLSPRSWPAGCLLLMLSLAAIVPAPAQTASPSERLSAERMWSLVRLGDVDLSPDGKLAVVTVTRFDIKENRSATDLWLFSTDGKTSRQLTSDKAADSSPRFSPDGTTIAFISKRGDDKESQLYLIAVDGGEARRVTEVPTGVSAPKWFADGSRIAFASAIWIDLVKWE